MLDKSDTEAQRLLISGTFAVFKMSVPPQYSNYFLIKMKKISLHLYLEF